MSILRLKEGLASGQSPCPAVRWRRERQAPKVKGLKTNGRYVLKLHLERVESIGCMDDTAIAIDCPPDQWIKKPNIIRP